MKKILSRKQEFFSEMIGTMILLAFGTGSVAMVVLFPGGGKGDYTTITMGWALGVLLGIFASSPSGAHLNPAVTLSLAITKRFSWNRVWYYMLGQVIGAFLGAMITYLIFYGQFDKMERFLSGSYSSIFSTFPAVEGYGYFDQVMGTAFLVFSILSIGAYKPNMDNLSPFMVSLVVLGIGISFGGMHGYAINPARDFGPRLFSLLAGLENTGFDNFSVWFLGPILSPFIGGVLGAIAFDKLRGKEEKEEYK